MQLLILQLADSCADQGEMALVRLPSNSDSVLEGAQIDDDIAALFAAVHIAKYLKCENGCKLRNHRNETAFFCI